MARYFGICQFFTVLRHWVPPMSPSYGYIIYSAFRQPKNYSSEMVWHFIGVNIINRTLHGRLKIRNSLLVLKNQRTSEIFFNTRRKISYLLAVIYYPLYTLFFFYKNVVFPAQAEYSYFSADFRLKIFLNYS